MNREGEIHASPRIAALVLALAASACASRASNLNVAAIPKDHGAFFGHVVVMDDGDTVTESCYAEFADAAGKRKAYVSLDETGWVFGSVELGPTYLSFVICTLGGLIKYNASYRPEGLEFDVRGGSDLAYFGDIVIDLNADGSSAVVGTLLGGAVGAAIAGSASPDEGAFHVDIQLEDGMREYKKRFGPSAAALTPRIALAPELIPIRREIPSKTAPAAAAATAFDRDAASRALGDAAGKAASCQAAAAPAGEGKVVVLFASNGAASSVELDPPFAGSASEPCLKQLFGSVKIPPYAGDAVRVSKRFSVPAPTVAEPANPPDAMPSPSASDSAR